MLARFPVRIDLLAKYFSDIGVHFKGDKLLRRSTCTIYIYTVYETPFHSNDTIWQQIDFSPMYPADLEIRIFRNCRIVVSTTTAAAATSRKDGCYFRFFVDCFSSSAQQRRVVFILKWQPGDGWANIKFCIWRRRTHRSHVSDKFHCNKGSAARRMPYVTWVML